MDTALWVRSVSPPRVHRLLVFLLLAESACSSGLAAGTARTVPAGDVQHAVGAAPLVLLADYCNEDGSGCGTDVAVLPPALHYQLRWGLTERLELGLLAGIPELGARLRWNFLRTESFALAVQPGAFAAFGAGLIVQVEDGPQPAAATPGLEAALLADVEVADALVLVPRVIGRWVPDPELGLWPQSVAVGELAFHLRVRRTIALEPSLGATAIVGPDVGTSLAPRVGFAVLWGGPSGDARSADELTPVDGAAGKQSWE